MRVLLYLVLHPKRLLALIGGFLAGVVYVWFAAVRAVPEVRGWKAAMRRAWRARRAKTTA